jgi:hypothetical protein
MKKYMSSPRNMLATVHRCDVGRDLISLSSHASIALPRQLSHDTCATDELLDVELQQARSCHNRTWRSWVNQCDTMSSRVSKPDWLKPNIITETDQDKISFFPVRRK